MQTSSVIAERLTGLNDWLQQEMEGWKVPGAAIGVLVGDEVVLAQGYGLRDVEQNLPVDADTLFAIGSCSKAFTTFDMGLLVDDGKLDWDKPVRDYLPDFRLYDPVATEFATPRDLVSHRTGLPRHDMSWYGSALRRAELYARLRHLKPNKTFRQRYEYQNLMFMTAGWLIEQVAGMTWEDYTQIRVFDTLDMRRSNFSVSVSEKDNNTAMPYNERKGEVKAIPFRRLDAVGPAGSINSSLNEMLRWLRLHMNKGKHNGEALISEATLREIHRPQTVMPITPDMPWYGSSEVENTAYALGWAVQTYRGRTMLRHTGGIDGFISSVSFFPHEGFGIVILTNLGDTIPATAFALHLFDRLLGLDQIAWSERLLQHKTKMEEAGEQQKQEALKTRKENTSPSHPLSDYDGTYEHPGYGTVAIAAEGECLVATYNGMQFEMRHHHYDTFQLTGDEVEVFLLVSFHNDALGNVQSVEIGFEPTMEALEFRKQPDAE